MIDASSENKKEIPIDRNSPVDGDFSYFRHQSSLSMMPCQVETRSPDTAMVGV